MATPNPEICHTSFATNAAKEAIMPTDAQMGRMPTTKASQTAPNPAQGRAIPPRARKTPGRAAGPATSTSRGYPKNGA